MITNPFFKIASPLKRFLVGILGVWFFSLSIAGYVNYFFPKTLAKHHTFENLSDWLFSLIGLILMGWILSEIFFPKLKIEGVFRVGDYEFCSTHPSYILTDLLTIAFATFCFWLGQTSKMEMPIFWLMLVTALLIPLIRLLAWYVLKLQIDDLEANEAYKPALLAFMIFAAIFGGLAISVFIKSAN